MKNKKLNSIFNQVQDFDTVRKLLSEPKVFEGHFSRIGGRAPEIWKDVSSNGAIYRWDTSQGPSIHIMPYYLAKILLEGSKIPYEVPYAYHDKTSMVRMKDGEIALGISRKSGIVAVMIKTETAFLLLDFQEKRNKTMETALEAISKLKPGEKFTAEVTPDGIKIKPEEKQTRRKNQRFTIPEL